MKILSGPGNNSKLGAKVVNWSRPVGPTCPSDCPFLTGVLSDGSRMPRPDLCYADRLEKAVPSVKEAWFHNAPRSDHASYTWKFWSDDLRADLSEAAASGYAVRGHVGGDFLRPLRKLDAHRDNRELDRDYVAAVLRAVRGAAPRPAMWFYTHAWRELAPHLKYFKRLGVEMFASVHTGPEKFLARSLGWDRLAVDGGERPDGAIPSWLSPSKLICPEQRLGHEKIDCSKCGYCFKPARGGRTDVVFLRHGPGTKTPKTGARHVE